MRVPTWFGAVLVAMSLVASASAHAACTPTATNYCVRWNTGGMEIKFGTGGTFTSRPTLYVVPGTTYTFEADDSSLTSHPFYLTTSSSGGGSGLGAVTSSISTAGATITITPTANQLSAGLYYNCYVHSGEGARINQCASGTYNNGGTCTACAPVAHCISPVTCTSAADSQCAACSAGFYLSGGACVACTAVPGCTSALSCTNAGNSQCTACSAGYFLSSGTCTSCTAMPGCDAGLTCTNAGNSQCASCSAGYFLSSGTCTTCTAVPGCASGLTCTNASNSVCAACAVPDDLNCYPVKDLKNPEFVKQEGVTISDERASVSADVAKPSFLCSPASVAGSSVTNPQSHLCCYKAKEPKLAEPEQVQITDASGSLQLQVGKATLVCRPCTTSPLP